MSAITSQNVIETMILPRPFARSSQDVIEAIVSTTVNLASARASQNTIEVLLVNVVPVVTRRYGPKIQSV